MDKKEKQKLIEWAFSGKSDKKKCTNTETAFSICDNKYDYMEYGFKSVVELEAQLKILWNGQDTYSQVVLLCAVAAFKKRWELKRNKVEKISSPHNKELIIPDYIYTL